MRKPDNFLIIEILRNFDIIELFEFRYFLLLPLDVAGIFEFQFDLFVQIAPEIGHLFWIGLPGQFIGPFGAADQLGKRHAFSIDRFIDLS